MMFFSRLTPDITEIQQSSLVRILGQDSYQDHQLIWRMFPDQPEAKRDFLFRREQLEGWPCFYVVSARKPRDPDGLWQIQTKPYAPRLREGQKLAFNIRVNPVISRWEGEGESRRQVRHDVVMDAKKGIGYYSLSRRDRPPLDELIQQAGVNWLTARCQASGFSIENGAVRVDGYQQHKVLKRGRNSPIQFSTLDFLGILTIEEPELFSQTLLKGMGKAKGLGCGLLMVRPVR